MASWSNVAALLLLLGLVLLIGLHLSTLPRYVVRRFLDEYWEYLGEVWFAQCLLGLAFGALLAIWLRRVYQSSPNQEALTLSQKVEGVALIALFIVGTTSTPLAELFREATFDTGVVSIKLAGAAQSNENTSKSNNLAPSTLDRSRGDPPAAPARADEEVGMNTIGQMHLHMERDAERIVRSIMTVTVQAGTKPAVSRKAALELANSIDVAADRYKENLFKFTECVRNLINKTGDDELSKSMLLALKPDLAQLYYLSLAKLNDSAAPEDTIAKSELAQAALDGDIKLLSESIALKLGTAMRNANSYAERIGRRTPGEELCLDKVGHYSAGDMAEILAADRPYLSLIYASILQLAHQEKLAIDILDEWIDLFSKRADDPLKETVLPWFRLRVQSTQYLLYESLFRRAPAQPQPVLRDHIDRMLGLERTYQDLPFIEQFYDKIFENRDIDLIESRFDAAPAFRAKCPESMNPDDLTLSWGLLSMRAVLARRMIQHADFIKNFQPEAQSLVAEIVNADYGCLMDNVDRNFVSNARAENVRVFALYTLTRLAERRSNGNSSSVARELELADSALHFAATLVIDNGTTEAAALKSDIDYLMTVVKGEIEKRSP